MIYNTKIDKMKKEKQDENEPVRREIMQCAVFLVYL